MDIKQLIFNCERITASLKLKVPQSGSGPANRPVSSTPKFSAPN